MNIRRSQNKWHTAAGWIVDFLSSERFFWIVISLFVFQALWFVVTARYPMAFDENFHLGLIKLHAQQWLPFFTHQPADATMYGAPVRDPSYLYHFLMSWPYRFISAVTASQTAQVIFLRLFDVAMFTYSLVLFRRILARLGGSRALNHTILFLFIMLPITPFLAAHINYDNLLILATAWSLLQACVWYALLKERRVSASQTTLLLSVLLLGCLVKYAFMPIAAGIVLFMAWQLWRSRSRWHNLGETWKESYKQLSRLKAVSLVGFALIAVFLFAERYGINVVRYHQINVDCGKVLSVQECSNYGPWERNYTYAQGKPSNFKPEFFEYVGIWSAGMWRRTFFAINYNFANKFPLPIPGFTTVVLGSVALVAFLGAARTILKRQALRQLAALIVGIYILSLFLQDYEGYEYTGVVVAANGRYLLPLMPLILLFAGLAIRRYWKKIHSAKSYVTLAVMLLFLQGGGVITYIVQSDSTWDWPNHKIVLMNNAARRVLKPIIVGSGNQQ